MSSAGLTTIRPAISTDAEQMRAIERELFGADAWSAEQIDHELARLSLDRWYVVAEQSDVLVGYAGIFLS